VSLPSIVDGIDYQARVFWTEAARVLTSPGVSAVGLEIGDVRAFDDVVVRLASPRRMVNGGRYEYDRLQAKFKRHADMTIDAASLIEPAWGGAKAVSLLQRLRAGVEDPAVPDSRYNIVTSARLEGALARSWWIDVMVSLTSRDCAHANRAGRCANFATRG
jgi:hypothetical protein